MDTLSIYYISLFIHNISLIPVIFLSFLFYFMLFQRFFLKFNFQKISSRKNNYYPFISIHIPVYNDLVVVRCIEKCLQLNYPKDRYEIIVIDDSDDENVKRAIDNFKNVENVKILRRDSREGFKAGALNYALAHTRGEIIVIFDSDEIPPKNFLRNIINYFNNEDVAMVQSKLKVYNANQNIITKFASILLLFYYNIILPIFYRNGVYHCTGSAVAIKKNVLLEVGGWNQKSVTEDADFTIKLMLKKYKAIYVEDIEVKAEVPSTLKSFLRQQARWTFGLVRVFVENWFLILFSRVLSFRQRILLLFQTFLFYFIGLFIILFTFSGLLVFITGEPREPSPTDLIRTVTIFILTSGFLANLYVVSYIEKINIRKELIFTLLTLGFILLLNNSYYFLKAFFTDKFYWIVTPKSFSIPTKFFHNCNKKKQNQNNIMEKKIWKNKK